VISDTARRMQERYERPVLDHGLVRLVDWLGDDLRIVNAAQASLDNESTYYTDREQGILRFLMREEHGVPFEHVVLTFKLRMPLFLCAQFKKHRHASWSEQSGRYDEFEDPQFYVPLPEHVRTQVGKPGNYTFKLVDPMTAQLFAHELHQHDLASVRHYQWALERGIAKEQARLFLPPGLYTNVVWTLNVRSLFNVIRLRADTHAQWEAQQYGAAFEDLARLVIPDTIDAFVAAGRPKP
jgi:thymidylate synthase (FAD)